MRVLLLLRGSAGCGKTTWIEQNGLKPYTLSADDLRLLCQSPIMNVDGMPAVSQSNDNVVWSTLFNILEVRMKRGEFTVIDATNSKTSEMNKYKKLCDTYRYRIYCVDFTDIPIEEVKRRNAEREPLKRVPDSVIDKMYSRFATQSIPAGIKVIKPNELDTIWFKPLDYSNYAKIHIIGDIHGSYTALQQYFETNDGMKDDELYIFTGDYLDRGCENVKVINFLLSIVDKKNVYMLEGNHERHLYNYSLDKTAASKEFEFYTKKELDTANVDKKAIRNLYRKFGQCAYFKHTDKVYVITHGGLSAVPENITVVATEQMIKGVGTYSDYICVEENFTKNTPENYVQIHGHRNSKMLPIKVDEKNYNLEGMVEFGGCLRALQITSNGVKTFEIKNTVYNLPECVAEKDAVLASSIADTVMKLRVNPCINENQFGDISAFNFTKSAFEKKQWNEQTVTARGLFIDTAKAKVVARGYNKFFNTNELPETKFDLLPYKLQFPVAAYVKENGFLGLVSYNEYTDDLFVTSKSAPDSEYAMWFKDILYKQVSQEYLDKMKNYIQEHNVTFVFECVDMVNDPHIIEYAESKLVLLDIIHNQLDFSKYPYDQLCYVAQQFGLTVKTKAYVLNTWQEFYDWYYTVLKEDYKYKDTYIEGFVVEDSMGYMFKLKLTYYNFWKFMRGISGEVLRTGNCRKTADLTTPVANAYFGWLKTKYAEGAVEQLPRDICTLRRMFYAETNVDV